ncbi:structural protein [Cellulophaga phage phi12a:1]|uniref:Structural protein n=1 Tax=Cellulophaga phage phi12a:1 TaxID=1327987 RepID=R9ZZV8_9VIRU|nr:structural protein [Cellulophaga phage phi12a:1]AGO48874.1 structural protein [Cellulophaga phage phi12a:1]
MVKFMQLSKKYWYVLVILAALIAFWIYKIFKKKPTSQTEASDKILIKEGVTFNDQAKRDLNNTAIQIAQHLGTSFPWYDPRSWSENDQDLFKIILPLSQKEFDLVAKLYFGVYAKGRDLRVDLANLLDAKYYEQLNVK